MPKIECEIEECELENEKGYLIPGVEATCSKCGHTTQSFGTSSRSIKRCLVMMREECPEGEKNFYAAEEQESIENQEARTPNSPVDSGSEPDDDIPF